MNITRRNFAATCRCINCRCASLCTCHALNALIALSLWDISHNLRHRKSRN